MALELHLTNTVRRFRVMAAGPVRQPGFRRHGCVGSGVCGPSGLQLASA